MPQCIHDVSSKTEKSSASSLATIPIAAAGNNYRLMGYYQIIPQLQ